MPFTDAPTLQTRSNNVFSAANKKKRTIVILHQRLTSICAMYLCSGRTDGGGIGWIDRKYFCGEGTANKETEGIELI